MFVQDENERQRKLSSHTRKLRLYRRVSSKSRYLTTIINILSTQKYRIGTILYFARERIRGKCRF